MSKKILMIKGSPIKTGNTGTLARMFEAGALSEGHEVRCFEAVNYRLDGCHGDNNCMKSGACGLKDDGVKLYELVEWADILVLASPVYWNTFTAQIKTVMDRFHPYVGELARQRCRIKEAYLLSCAMIDDIKAFEGITASYEHFCHVLNFSDAGRILVPGVCSPGEIQVKEEALKEAYIMGKNVGKGSCGKNEKELMALYIKGLNQNDADFIGRLYAEKGCFWDGALRYVNQPEVCVFGPEAVETFFKGMFEKYKFRAVMLKSNQQSMEYNVYLNETCLPCVCTLLANEEGKIIEHIIRPR